MISSELTQQHTTLRSALPITSLSVVIPTYFDETTIGPLVTDVNCLLKELCQDYEIIVTNDGSKDKTLQILQDLIQTIPQLKIINHVNNKGFGYTIRELYYAGTKDFVFSLPGDYQFAPKELMKMAAGLHNYDLVIGWRVKRNDPPRRKFQSLVYNALLHTIYGINYKDVNSIKLFRRSILNEIELKSTTAFVDAEFCIRANRSGFKIIEIPIEHLPRLSQGASGGKLSVIKETFSDLFFMRADILHNK